MRIAVPFEPETGMIAQHFGSAETLRLYTEDDGVVFADDVASPANGAEGVADFLVEQDARIVLCYDLGENGRDVLFERNIAVLAGLMGKADDAVIALLENRLRYAGAAEASGGCSCGCGGHHDGGSCDCGETCGDDCGCGCGC